MLRQRSICPKPGVCPESLNEWDRAVDQAPPPCLECPLERLREYLETPRGRLLANVVDLDFAIQVRATAWFSDVSYLEFLLLRLLAEERSTYEGEQIREKQKTPPHA